MVLQNIKRKHPHIHLAHSMYLTLFSYFNIVAFISNKQDYNHTNKIYLISIYLSIIFILIDSFLSSMLNITSIVIHNILYVTCLINTIISYGNLLSIVLFIIESTNVTIDWIIVTQISKKKDGSKVSYNLILLGIAFYAIVSKVIISPFVLMVIFYNLSGNFAEPLFILLFCIYTASLVRLSDELKHIANLSNFFDNFTKKLSKHLENIDRPIN